MSDDATEELICDVTSPERPFVISGATKEGLGLLLERCWQLTDREPVKW